MTEEPTLLAVDAGTSTVKTVAFRTDGEEIASSSRETEILRPASGQIEQDPTEVWKQVVETIKAVSSELPADAVPVGIAITGQGDGLWAVTDEGEPVGNAILWSDSRAHRFSMNGPRVDGSTRSLHSADRLPILE